MICDYNAEQLFDLVNHQTKNFWNLRGGINDERLFSLNKTIERIEENFIHWNSKYIKADEAVRFNVTHTNQYAVFLYTYSNQLYLDGDEESAAKIYYLNRIMHSVNWFYAVNFPSIFSAEHPLGSVIGRGKFNDYLLLYQGTTIGGNWKGDKIHYPQLGHHVVMYSDSKVLGDSHIGNNVILAANAYVINEDIPDNCIVFGQSPNIVIKPIDTDDITHRINRFWR